MSPTQHPELMQTFLAAFVEADRAVVHGGVEQAYTATVRSIEALESLGYLTDELHAEAIRYRRRVRLSQPRRLRDAAW